MSSDQDDAVPDFKSIRERFNQTSQAPLDVPKTGRKFKPNEPARSSFSVTSGMDPELAEKLKKRQKSLADVNADNEDSEETSHSDDRRNSDRTESQNSIEGERTGSFRDIKSFWGQKNEEIPEETHTEGNRDRPGLKDEQDHEPSASLEIPVATKPEKAEAPHSSHPDKSEIPDSAEPDEAEIPDSTEQEVSEIPESTQPESTEIPDSTKPDDSAMPDAAQPDQSEISDSAHPENSEIPDSTQPDKAATPDSTQPDNAATPDSTQPDSSGIPASVQPGIPDQQSEAADQAQDSNSEKTEVNEQKPNEVNEPEISTVEAEVEEASSSARESSAPPPAEEAPVVAVIEPDQSSSVADEPPQNPEEPEKKQDDSSEPQPVEVESVARSGSYGKSSSGKFQKGRLSMDAARGSSTLRRVVSAKAESSDMDPELKRKLRRRLNSLGDTEVAKKDIEVALEKSKKERIESIRKINAEKRYNPDQPVNDPRRFSVQDKPVNIGKLNQQLIMNRLLQQHQQRFAEKLETMYGDKYTGKKIKMDDIISYWSRTKQADPEIKKLGKKFEPKLDSSGESGTESDMDKAIQSLMEEDSDFAEGSDFQAALKKYLELEQKEIEEEEIFLKKSGGLKKSRSFNSLLLRDEQQRKQEEEEYEELLREMRRNLKEASSHEERARIENEMSRIEATRRRQNQYEALRQSAEDAIKEYNPQYREVLGGQITGEPCDDQYLDFEQVLNSWVRLRLSSNEDSTIRVSEDRKSRALEDAADEDETMQAVDKVVANCEFSSDYGLHSALQSYLEEEFYEKHPGLEAELSQAQKSSEQPAQEPKSEEERLKDLRRQLRRNSLSPEDRSRLQEEYTELRKSRYQNSREAARENLQKILDERNKALNDEMAKQDSKHQTVAKFMADDVIGYWQKTESQSDVDTWSSNERALDSLLDADLARGDLSLEDALRAYSAVLKNEARSLQIGTLASDSDLEKVPTEEEGGRKKRKQKKTEAVPDIPPTPHAESGMDENPAVLSHVEETRVSPPGQTNEKRPLLDSTNDVAGGGRARGGGGCCCALL